MEIEKDNKVLLDNQKFFAESAKENIKNYPEKRKMHENNKRPDPKDYDDFIEWWNEVEKWEREQKRMKKAKAYH